MVDRSAQPLDRVFRALASEPRRHILRRTARRRCTVTELSRHFDMTLAAVSKHVRVLADAGLLSLEREGRLHWCRFQPAALERAAASLEQLRSFWNERLDALEDILRDERDRSPRKGKR